MKIPNTPINEKERLEALYSYDLLNEIEQKEFNDIVNLAASICDVPISLITLIDVSVQWHKAKFGDIGSFVDRKISFCGHAINDPHEVLVVSDATQDQRFADNPLVTGEPFISFYAGVPLVTGDGFSLGALCVIDQKPRELKKSQIEALQILSAQVIRLFELRRTVKELEEKEDLLEQSVKNLEEYTAVVAHDLKVPFRSIEIMAELIRKKNKNKLDEECQDFLTNIQKETTESTQFINDLLRYSKSIHSYNDDRRLIEMKELVNRIFNKLNTPQNDNISLCLSADLPTIYHSRTAVQHIFENLIQNSIKFTDHPEPKISLDYESKDKNHVFHFEDNGKGIPKEMHQTIFELFQQGNQNESKVVKGIGVGLATINKLVQLMGGKVSVESEVGKGTIFTIEIPKSGLL